MIPLPIGRYLKLILFRLSKPPVMRQMDPTCAVPTMSVAAHMIRPKPCVVRSSRRNCRASAGFLATSRRVPDPGDDLNARKFELPPFGEIGQHLGNSEPT